MIGQLASSIERHFPAAILLGGLAVTFVCALVMTGAHWTPGGLITHDTYNWAFTVHGAPVLVLMPAVLLFVAERDGPRVTGPRWLVPTAWGALSLEACVLALRLAAEGNDPWQQWTSFALFPPCALVAVAVLLRRPQPLRARSAALLLAGFVQLVGLGIALPLDLTGKLDPNLRPDFSSLGHFFMAWTFEATALAAVTVAVGDLPGKREPWVPVLVLIAATLIPQGSLYELLSVPAAGACALWLAARSLRGRERRSTGERLFAALAALTFLESATLGQLLRWVGVDVLRDTYVSVGLLHLRAATCVLAALAVLLRRHQFGRQTWPVCLAATLSAVGSQFMAFAMVVVGTRGMPRRYFNYLPEFQSLHRVIAVAGALFMLGTLFVVLSCWRPTLRRDG